jgi:phage baseplate assembly protein W
MSSDNIGLGFYNENGITFQTEGKHIIENVKRILTTRRGERIGNLSFGSDVSKYLFMPDLTIDDLITEIVNSIKRCEPRVIVEECSLSSKKDFDAVIIDLKLRLKSSGEEIEASVEL